MSKTTRWLMLVLGLLALAAIIYVLVLDPTTGESNPDEVTVPATETSTMPAPEPVVGRRVVDLGMPLESVRAA